MDTRYDLTNTGADLAISGLSDDGKASPEEIKEAQAILRELGYNSVMVNGSIDLPTTLALVDFRMKHKIAQTSANENLLSPATMELLRSFKKSWISSNWQYLAGGGVVLAMVTGVVLWARKK